MNDLRKLLYGLARLLGDVNAVRRGKIGNRLMNKAIGRATGKLFRKGKR